MNTKTIESPPPDLHDAVSMVGAVDMSSKNFKFALGQRFNGVITTELIRKERFELGKEVTENNGLIREERIPQVQQSLSRFVHYCNDRGASEVLAIAASAIRNARNYQRILDVAYAAGLNLEIGDGAREGEVGYFAATGGAPNKLVTEIGSKSMQVAWESDGDIRSSSVSVGYELAYESFVESESTLHAAEKGFRRFLDGNFGDLPESTDQYFALAANSAACFATGKKHVGPGRTLDMEVLDGAMAKLRALPTAQYNDLKSSLPKAAKILPGLIFIQYIMERSGHRQMFVSENELPVGLIVDYFLNPA